MQDMNLTTAARSMFRYLLLDEKNKILYAKVPKVRTVLFFKTCLDGASRNSLVANSEAIYCNLFLQGWRAYPICSTLDPQAIGQMF